ncbi:hypothetical protein chiPu_0001936 [Chiloscyllium punctatum]|uniref:UBZ2-type domain-containing protein n=1 Tax=Chiloscyllium punctatum TaxID=137246 RepID=A0A401RZJ5_CHIPU|nr:hypothetical protein [Chiloscyllium punctatum]
MKANLAKKGENVEWLTQSVHLWSLMAEEKKLKLKRKRVPDQSRRELNPNPPLPAVCHFIKETGSDSTREQPGAQRKELPFAVSTWLNNDDLNENDHIWAVLIKSIFLGREVTNWKTVPVPDLPPSPEKIIKTTEPVISAGKETFTWIPFPPVCRAVNLKIKCKSHLFLNQRDASFRKRDMIHSSEPQMGRSQLSVSMRSESNLSSIDKPKENLTPGDIFGIDPSLFSPESAASKHEKSYLVDEQHGREDMPVDVTHCPIASLQQNEREPKQSVLELQSNLKPHKGKIKQHIVGMKEILCAEDNDDDVITGECQDHSFSVDEFCTTSKMTVAAVNKGRPDTQIAGELELESCPMCLMQFPAGFSVLEVDNHLAKCLSESTEDVIW